MVAEAKPVFVTAGIEQGFKITAAQLEAAITPKSRLIFINSPSNPSAAVYTLEELKALGEVLRKHPRIVIASDDMYEQILLDGSKFVNILNACPDLYDRTVVENGVSKAYSMTGWRIGYCGGPQELIEAMENMQSHSTSNPTSIAQYAAEAALNGDQSCIAPMVKAFKERGAFVAEALNRIPGVKCLQPAGAFYVFPDCRAAIQRMAAAGKLKAAHRHRAVRLPHGAGRGGGRGAGLGLRHGRLPAHLLRHLDGEPEEGHGPHGPRDGLRGYGRPGLQSARRAASPRRSRASRRVRPPGRRPR